MIHLGISLFVFIVRWLLCSISITRRNQGPHQGKGERGKEGENGGRGRRSRGRIREKGNGERGTRGDRKRKRGRGERKRLRRRGKEGKDRGNGRKGKERRGREGKEWSGKGKGKGKDGEEVGRGRRDGEEERRETNEHTTGDPDALEITYDEKEKGFERGEGKGGEDEDGKYLVNEYFVETNSILSISSVISFGSGCNLFFDYQ